MDLSKKTRKTTVTIGFITSAGVGELATYFPTVNFDIANYESDDEQDDDGNKVPNTPFKTPKHMCYDRHVLTHLFASKIDHPIYIERYVAAKERLYYFGSEKVITPKQFMSLHRIKNVRSIISPNVSLETPVTPCDNSYHDKILGREPSSATKRRREEKNEKQSKKVKRSRKE